MHENDKCYYSYQVCLSCRSLSGHKLSGFIPPDLGKLDQLKFLYVSWRNIFASLVVCVNGISKCVLLLMMSMMSHGADLFMTTTSMVLFLQTWGIARNCKECKYTSTNFNI